MPPLRLTNRTAAPALLIVLALALLVAARQQTSDLRELVYYPLGFAGMGMALTLGLWNLRHPQLEKPAPWWWLGCAAPLLFSLGLLLALTDPPVVDRLLGGLQRRLVAPHFPALGAALAAIIFMPLAWRIARRQAFSTLKTDIVAITGLLALALLVYLPLGFSSIGNYESWTFRAYVEGMFSWTAAYELLTRPWGTLPHFVGTLLTPDSFVAFHWLNMLFIWGKAACLYGILRKHGVMPLWGFLTALLCLVYPVNSHLFSLRSLSINLSAVALAGALFLALDHRKQPSRWHLGGLWLALSFTVFINEGGYVLILALPLLWLWRRGETGWRAGNLTVIWFLVPAGKLAYMLFLSGNGARFYYSNLFEGFVSGGIGGGELLANVLPGLVAVYRHTFVDAWLAALRSLDGGEWLTTGLAALLLSACLCWLLARTSQDQPLPDARDLRRSLLLGLSLILLAVGVFIWIAQYNQDLWRPYFFVGEGAAIAVFSLGSLVTLPIRRPKLRAFALCLFCLALCLPAFAVALEKRAEDIRRADSKARLIGNLVRAAPQIQPGTVVMLTADMDGDQLRATDFAELNESNDLDYSIYYLLYPNQPPAYFCRSDGVCQAMPDEETLFNSDDPAELLQRTLVFQLYADLSVELLEDPAAYLGWDIDIDYDASRLYDADAPLPPRAQTMLGPALSRR